MKGFKNTKHQTKTKVKPQKNFDNFLGEWAEDFWRQLQQPIILVLDRSRWPQSASHHGPLNFLKGKVLVKS